jgi:hypothetical protein
VLFGASRLGKTLWARSLGPHIYFGGLFSAAEAAKSGDAEYAVFDDMQGGLDFFHGYKNWLGCQPEFTIKQLYKDPHLMYWGKPSIWVCNKDPRIVNDKSLIDLEWLDANCIFVEVRETIFRASTELS